MHCRWDGDGSQPSLVNNFKTFFSMKRFYHVYFLWVLWELHTYCVLVISTPSSSPSILPKSLLFPLPKVIPSPCLSFHLTQCYPNAPVWLPDHGQPSRVTPLKKTDFAPSAAPPPFKLDWEVHVDWLELVEVLTLWVHGWRSPVMSRRHSLTAALPTSASNQLSGPPPMMLLSLECKGHGRVVSFQAEHSHT